MISLIEDAINIVDDAYCNQYRDFMLNDLSPFVDDFLTLIADVRRDARYFFVGNGASAAIASHLANDFSKALGVRASTFHDPALMTCFGNDYGYEHWASEAVKLYGERGDVLVLISSSGRSKNIVNAALMAKSKGMKVVSLTGPNPDDLLIEQSLVTLRVASNLYNVVECSHMMALCAVVDSCKMVMISEEETSI